jgi:hypothetical protein
MNKKTLKFLLGIITATMLMGMPVFASEPLPDDMITIESGEEEPTREEALMWFFRTYNGMRQKRLWSLTYQHWVTDWIDIGPA